MSLFLDGIGAIVKKATEWIPSKRESYSNQIEKLRNENAELQKETPLSARTANRISINADRIKLLRDKKDRIN